VAFCALVLIGSGAFLTSSQNPAASKAIATRTASVEVFYHLIAAAVVGILTLGLVVWLLFVAKNVWLRGLSWFALALFALDAWSGLWNLPSGVIVHACLAPVFFATLVAICLLLSAGWREQAEAVDDRGLASLRLLALVAPPLVLVQIALGAAYRHKVMSVMWHMAGAMIVSLVTLIACTLILQRYPAHRLLRPAAIAVLSIVLLQVTLGVTAFVIALLDTGSVLSLVLSTVSHVLVGSMTLASTLLLGMQLQRSFTARPVDQPV
jgi:cytochrome c oxidase assembly protein subunit 15